MSIHAEGVCPECQTDMKGNPIPEKSQESYGGKKHFSRLIGVEYAYGSPERYDGVSEWLCPDCGYREGRWTGNKLNDGEVEPRFGGQK